MTSFRVGAKVKMKGKLPDILRGMNESGEVVKHAEGVVWVKWEDDHTVMPYDVDNVELLYPN